MMKSDNLIFPREISCIGLAAPSSAVNAEQYQDALHFLRSTGLQVIPECSPDEKDSLPYLSASPETRLKHLNALIRNPEIQAIYCLRGGFGAIHLLEDIDWDTLRLRKLPLIGFSDITALHTAMIRKRAGIPVTARMAVHLKEDSSSVSFRRNFLRAMTLAIHPNCGKFKKTASLIPLKSRTEPCSGKLAGGNMTVLASLCGTPFQLSGKDRILLLEEIGEPVRKLDSILNQLRLSGVFRHCKGVIFGDFNDCGDAELREIMLRRFAESLDVPVYAGLHFGHCRKSLSFVFGETAKAESNGLYVRHPVQRT